MRRGESGEAQDKVFKRYEFSAKGKFLGRVRIWGASMGFLRVFCGALTTRLCGFCGVSLTWRVLLLFSVDVKCLFRYDRDMADQSCASLARRAKLTANRPSLSAGTLRFKVLPAYMDMGD